MVWMINEKKLSSQEIEGITGIKLDGRQLGASEVRYLTELSDDVGNENKIYLQIFETFFPIKLLFPV
jgi:hypothetical protein